MASGGFDPDPQRGAAQHQPLPCRQDRHITSGEQVLDAGCGLGGSSLWLARERGAVVDGITISEKQVKVANGSAAGMKLGDRARFHLKDFAATEFPDASFDVVWAIERSTRCARRRSACGTVGGSSISRPVSSA